ncbi:MAG TPA: hypothetical protein VLI40_00105 [Gemmatimonadaceae bacterium]|nr:hypothetical protein [Gemmatimonadaceae bacterium]
MTSISLHPTPSSRTVATEEFRAVGLALRTEAIFFVAALVVFGVIIVAAAVRFAHGDHSPNARMGFRYDSSGAIPMFLVGLLIPFGVWRSEDPARRSYHWSMPVARGPHTVMKLLSGWGWLMIATILYLLFVIAVAYSVSMITGGEAWQRSTPAWEWAVAFTAPTLGYLLTSIAVIGSDHPWRWIGGILIGYGVLLAVLKSFGMDDFVRALNAISDGRYGLNAALFGTVTDGARGITVGVTRETMATMRMGTWVLAMPLWLIGSAIAVTIASYRHRE